MTEIMKIKNILLLVFAVVVLVSCSQPKKLAYDFVNKSKGAKVAFYVPDELKKANIRRDCDPNNIDLVLLDEDQLRDTIEARTKIINKIDDKVFLSVMIASFEETLKDYDLELDYWENETTSPDSLHWVVDMSHVEITELIEYLITQCGVEGNHEFLSSTTVNVASWFELMNGDYSKMLFTEQNYGEYILDCYYTLDTVNNLVINAEIQQLTLDGFYDFAVILGRLYAGYTYDFFMNDYVRQQYLKKEKEYPETDYLRYDPYESYIYHTRKDKFIPIEE